LFPEATGIDAWDGQLTYSDLDRHSTALACLLVNIGIAPEVLVPLCFAKSKWVVVAMLAVAKSGGAFVPMEPSQLVNRLKSILSQT
jgi:non-ribosomal peptide synthetase component F